MIDNFELGGTEVKLDAGEAIQEIPQNKILLIEKLTYDAPIKPEIAKGLKTVEEVFQHYRPQIEVDFETSEGTTQKENLNFKNLGDFGIKGITAQSEFLKNLTTEKNQHNKIIKQLKTNKILKAALTDPEAKAALSAAISGLINELNDLEK
jgi:CRISPR/Cas system-associated protein Csx1